MLAASQAHAQAPLQPQTTPQPQTAPQAQTTPQPASPAQAALPGCQKGDEIPEAVRAAVETAAQHAFDQASRGDVVALRAGSIDSLQANFNGVAAVVAENKAALAGARAQTRAIFVLNAVLNAGASPDSYTCGAFSASGLASGSAVFNLPGLAPGKWAIAIQDITGPKGPFAMTTIFQDVSGWKLAGFYVRPEAANGHDGLWYLLRAREYKAKGQGHNAWFYYVTSWDLLAPVKFMETNLLGKIIQESAGLQPPYLPLSGSTVNFSANGKTYTLTEISVFGTDKSLDLAIKYTVPSAADFAATQADARSLATAFAGQHPELKDAFDNLWAHAVDPSGADVAAAVSLKGTAKP